MIRFAEDLLWVVPVGTVLDSVAVVTGAFPCPIAAAAVAAGGCLRDLRDPVAQVLEVPSLAGTAGAEDIESAVAVHRRDLACDGPDSHQGPRPHCLAVDQEAAVALVGHRDRVTDRTHPGTVAGVSNCLANVVNTAAIEDCVVDMVTSAGDQAFQRPVRRD